MYILFTDANVFNKSYPDTISINDILSDNGYQQNVKYKLTQYVGNTKTFDIPSLGIDFTITWVD